MNELQISELVERFYSRARQDELLGPVFAAAVGDHWDTHLAKMKDFWSTLMLATRRYKGNPMMAHMVVPGIGPAHFERWLALWRETAAQTCPAPWDALYIAKAEMIGERLLAAIASQYAV